MPSKEQHLRKASHNEYFLNSFNISITKYLDWIVTASFYAALHYVDAYIDFNYSKHPGNHNLREKYINMDSKLKIIFNDYWDLKNDSIQSRYSVYKFKVPEVKNEVIPKLQSIKNYILNLL